MNRERFRRACSRIRLPRWSRKHFYSCFLALVPLYQTAEANDALVEAQTNQSLDIFFNLCVTDQYRAQLLFDLAEKELWPRLPTRLVESRRMPDLERFEGWIGYLPAFSEAKFLVYAGNATDTFQSRPVRVETCSMFFGSVLAEEFIELVRDELDDRVIEELKEGTNSRIVILAPDTDRLVVTLLVDENTVEGRGIFASTILLVDDDR